MFGISRHVKIIDCSSKNTWHANYSTHNDADLVDFINCKALGSGIAGFNPRSSRIRLIGCQTNDAPQGFYLSGNPRNIEIVGCRAENVQGYIYALPVSGHDVEDIVIRDNNFYAATDGGITISLQGGTQTGVIDILNNNLQDTKTTGNGAPIRVLGAAANVNIIGNFSDGTDGGFHARIESDISKVTVIGNHFCNGIRPLTILSGVGTGLVYNNTQYNNTTSTLWSNAATVKAGANNEGDFGVSGPVANFYLRDTDDPNEAFTRIYSYSGTFIIDVDPNDNGGLSSSFRVRIDGVECFRVDAAGNLLIGTTTPGASKLVVNDDSIQINSPKTPASATDACATGEIAWDESYIYVCTAPNTWRRAALSTW